MGETSLRKVVSAHVRRQFSRIRRQFGLFAPHKHWPVVVIVWVGIVLSIAAYAWARYLEERDIRFFFEREVHTQTNAVDAATQEHLIKTRVVGNHLQSLEEPDPAAFRLFAGAILAGRPNIIGFQWVPRVTGEERAAFEARLQQSGQDRGITQINAEGQVVPAEGRSVYFPVELTEPFESEWLGLDIGQLPSVAGALMEAGRTGEMRLRRGPPVVPLAPAVEDASPRLLAVMPVYQPGAVLNSPESREEYLRGFAIGVYGISAILHEALEPFYDPTIPVVHRLYLRFDADQYRFVASAGNGVTDVPRILDEAVLRGVEARPFQNADWFGPLGQGWLMISEPAAGAVEDLRTAMPLTVLGAGLLLTWVIAGYFWTLINRAVEIGRIVEERTCELARANEELRQENARRLAAEREALQAVDAEREALQAVQKAKEELTVSEARYRVMGETLPYGVWLTDAQGQPQYFSQSFLDLLQMTLEETRDFGWTRRLAPEEVESAIAHKRQALRTGRMWETEHRFLASDGQYRIVLVRGLPVRNSADEITSWVGINLDITDRKLAEEELRQHRDYLEELVRARTLELMISNEELRHDIEQREKVEEALRILQDNLEEQVKARTAELAAANRELEAFSYSVSHDLRAPLRHIVGFVQLLQKQAHDQLGEAGQRHLQIITQAASRMGKLIDDLLQFSRMGRSAMRKTSVPVATVVEEVRQELQTDLNGTRVEWVIGDLPHVQADPALLKVVLGNLLSNALKYSRKREGARIEVGTLDAAGDELTIFVRDNGVGFDMQYAERLFGVFQRLHQAEEFEGTGIGLAIVQRIIHRHGGRVWAEGVPDRGATFYFSLPRGKELDERVEAHSAGRR